MQQCTARKENINKYLRNHEYLVFNSFVHILIKLGR